MKRITGSFLIGSLVVLVGCTGSKTPDTQAMLGMSFQTCVMQYSLDQHKSWHTPNLPPGSDSEVTYFLPTGNLVLQFDPQEKITFATFDPSDKPAEERLEEVYAGWNEWVEAHTIKKTQP